MNKQPEIDREYTGMPKLTPKQAKADIATLILCQKPFFLHGPAGIGKSDIIEQVANDLGYGLTTKIVALDDLVELAGHYKIDEQTGKTHRHAPEWLPDTEKEFLFFDEFNTALPEKQNALLSFIRTQRIGRYKLPANCSMGMAGNRKMDAAHVFALSSATKNRLAHMELVPSVDDWIGDYALPNGVYAPIIAHVRYGGLDTLYRYDPKTNLHSFPTPRSLVNCSDILLGNHHKPEQEFTLIAEQIGEGDAVQLLGFIRTCRELPHLDTLIAQPDTAMLPDKPNVRYMVSVGLSRRADRQNIANILTYAARLGGEWETLIVLEAQRLCKGITTTRAFIDYAASHNWAVVN